MKDASIRILDRISFINGMELPFRLYNFSEIPVRTSVFTNTHIYADLHTQLYTQGNEKCK
uniref:Uncharacterized protein n=1 Tax=viral metagenome TaxID=1070528 RepID=A0A6M3X5G8_9ZZZZ